MDKTFKTKNKKKIEPHRLILHLTNKIDSKRPHKRNSFIRHGETLKKT